MSNSAAQHEGYGSRSYRAYVLGALLVVYTSNFVDRILVGVVQESIRAEFSLNDLQLGILGGPTFAILYTLAGIPIARYAERANRVNIVAIGLAVWSAMTALCGFAVNYTHLLLARIGVGIGEAACTPPSHSVISDYFPANRRASALSIWALGIPIGTMLAAFGGGWLTAHFDWRNAFLMLGAPGLAIALIVKLTVREPPRQGPAAATPKFGEAIKALAGKASFWHAALGASLISFVGYGSAQFLVSYFVRNYELAPTLPEEIARGSYAFGLIAGLAVGLGTFLGGVLSDRFAAKHPNAPSWLPALGIGIAAPVYLLAFAQSDFNVAFALLLVAPIFHYLYLGPTFAVVQSVVEPRMRATATALALLVINLIGYGLGPPAVGLAADLFTVHFLGEVGFAPPDCEIAANLPVCAAASAKGLKFALCASMIMMVWAAFHFLRAGRTLQRDRVS